MKFISVVVKELQEMSHDRTMLAVLLAFPIFIMLFMGSSFRSMEISGLPIGVVGPQNTTFSSLLLSGLNDSKAFNLHNYDSEAVAMDDFRNGHLKAVIVVPEDFEQTLDQGNGSRIRIIVDNSDLALEQSVIAAMSSVVQASSADITKKYVSGAWEELGALNSSASSLAKDIAASRTKMNQTKARLDEVGNGLGGLNISRLEASIDNAIAVSGSLREQLAMQRSAMMKVSEGSAAFLDNTSLMLMNASAALNESISTVQYTHAKLLSSIDSLNQTVNTLDNAIFGLGLIRNATADDTSRAAIDLDIMSLQSLRNSTMQQISDAQDEAARLRGLNATLNGFGAVLDNYSVSLDAARSSNDTARMVAAIDGASATIGGLNSTFASAKQDVASLSKVVSDVREAMHDINSTLDQALAQTSSVDNLISSLEKTVEEQTARDPERIASPLAIEVRNQYVRTSFVDFLMPQIISISLLFSCFLLASISMVREKTGNTIVRALMSPLGLENMVAGKIATLVLLSIAQVAIIIAVALALFGVQPPTDLATLAAGTVVSALVLSSIGILVGFYARSESAAIQTCLLLAIPMLFLGNIVFSPDLLPNYTQILQQLLPLAHVTSIFKIVLITNGDPAGDMAALVSYFVLLALAMAFIMIKRRDISNY